MKLCSVGRNKLSGQCDLIFQCGNQFTFKESFLLPIKKNGWKFVALFLTTDFSESIRKNMVVWNRGIWAICFNNSWLSLASSIFDVISANNTLKYDFFLIEHYMALLANIDNIFWELSGETSCYKLGVIDKSQVICLLPCTRHWAPVTL